MNWNRLKALSIWDFAVFAIVVFFIIVKIPFLDYPYFWDEAWVYAPAVFDMFENGPSLSPDSIDPYLSRGHPILFHFFAVCWMTIFGSSFIAVHSFTLFLSVCLLLAVYALGIQLFNRSTGFWAAGLLAIQPIFLEQSGFLLPEIQLALFTVLTILFYLKRSILLFILSGTCLLLTKETGILTIGVIGLVEIFQFAADRELSKKRVAILFSTAAPIVLTFIYFLVQYFQFGWFMFPEHMSMFNTEPNNWLRHIGYAKEIVLNQQQRGLLVAVALAALGLGWNKGPIASRILATLLALSFITIKELNSWLPDWYFNYALPVILILFAISMIKPLFKHGTVNHLFFPISILLMVVMMVFTAAHFFIDRYFLFLFPLLFVAISLAIHLALKQTAWLKNVLLISVGFMVYHNMNRIDSRKRGNNLRYIECITVCQKTVNYLLEEVGENDVCVSGSYTFRETLKAPAAGYVTPEQAITCLPSSVLDMTDYIVDVSYEPCNTDVPFSEMPDFEEIWRVEDRAEWAVIYKRISP